MAPWLTAALVAALGAPADLVAVSRAVDGHGTAVLIEGSVEAPAWAVEAVVRDIRRYPDWFPSMRSAEPLSGGVYDAVFQLPWPLKTLRERIAFARTAAAGVVLVRWRQLSGDFARDEGTWTLAALGPTRTAVRYQALIEFRRWVPGWLIRRAQRRAGPRILASIEARALLLTRSASR